MPYTQDPSELDGVDVAIVGAPTDDLVSDRPGARTAPAPARPLPCREGGAGVGPSSSPPFPREEGGRGG